MELQTMQKKLETIRSLIEKEPGRAIVFWSNPEGKWYRYARLCFLSLVAVYHDGENCRAVSLAGTITRDADKAQKLLFEYGSLVRIKSGNRKNMVVTPERLYPDEHGSIAGLSKRLEFGSDGSCFSLSAEADSELLERICFFLDKEKMRHAEHPQMPVFYIKTREPETLKQRITGSAMNVMKGMAEYDQDATLDVNFRKCMHALSLPDEEPESQWRLYPFAYCEGKGVAVVDADQLPDACSVPLSAFPHDSGLVKIVLPGGKR